MSCIVLACCVCACGRVSTRTGVPHVASFNSRRMGALNAIAEEHWKRQMKEQEKQEEQVHVCVCVDRQGIDYILFKCCTCHTTIHHLILFCLVGESCGRGGTKERV